MSDDKENSNNKDRSDLNNWTDKGKCIAVFMDEVLHGPLLNYHPKIGEDWSVDAMNKDELGNVLDHIIMKPFGRRGGPKTGRWHNVPINVMKKLKLKLNTTNEAPYLIHEGINHKTNAMWTLISWRVNAVKWREKGVYIDAYLDTLLWKHETSNQKAYSGWTWNNT
ncbi:MAG: hypothetical protein MJK04_35745 [Psychrosphaera sp.]|nr:hypothetical protein [Psychrosphaera sp.]